VAAAIIPSVDDALRSGGRGPGPVLIALALLLAAAFVSQQLFVPPVVGLANNGDFEKVMGYAGLQYLPGASADRYYSWIQTRFAVVPPGWYRSGYLTTETLLAFLARGLHTLRPGGDVFDIRVLGAVHAVLFLAGLALLLSASRRWPAPLLVASASLLVFVFTDVGYVAPLNSFYSQTASLVFLLLTLGTAALALSRGGLRGSLLVVYFVSAALFVASKPQESLQGPLLALLGLRLAGAGWRRRGESSAWALALALCLFSLWYNLQTLPAYRRLAKYGAVFLEMLPNSASPGNDLAALGLDPTWARFAGQTPFPRDFPGDAFDRLGYTRILAFYLEHPARFAALVRRAAPSAFELRPPALGNFEESTGAPPRSKSRRFALWSSLRARLSPHAAVALVVIFAAALASAIVGYPGRTPAGRRAREGLVVLLLMASAEFFVCVLADSLFGLARHLFLFQALLDLLVVAVAVGLLARLLPAGSEKTGSRVVHTVLRTVGS